MKPLTVARENSSPREPAASRAARRTVVFTGDIFRHQPHGGVSRIFVELLRGLERPTAVLAGYHRSRILDPTHPSVVTRGRMREFPGQARFYAAANRRFDREALRLHDAAIVHPTYYRHPDTLPECQPVVVTVFDMAHERHPERFRRPWWSSVDPARHKAALCRRAQAIVCISDATRRDLLEVVPLPAEKTRVIHLGSPSWSGIEPEAIRGAKPPFFTWVGERRGYKNFLATLTAWATLPEVDDTVLLCLGGGALDPEERRAVQTLGVEGRVLHSECSDGQLRWAYENACGLLYTSLWEGFGLPILEAMSLGCPVVASDREALRETSGAHAILVEPTDGEDLCKAIAQCRASGREVGRAGRVAHARSFSWEACVAAHEALYRELDE